MKMVQHSPLLRTFLLPAFSPGQCTRHRTEDGRILRILLGSADGGCPRTRLRLLWRLPRAASESGGPAACQAPCDQGHAAARVNGRDALSRDISELPKTPVLGNMWLLLLPMRFSLYTTPALPPSGQGTRFIPESTAPPTWL